MAICIVIHASHTLIPNLKESKLWKELVKEMAWLTTILQWRGFLRLFRQNFQFLFRICSLPSCTWTDHLSDKIESGHKVGTIPQRQDKSKHTFRNGDILYVSINNFFEVINSPFKYIIWTEIVEYWIYGWVERYSHRKVCLRAIHVITIIVIVIIDDNLSSFLTSFCPKVYFPEILWNR